MGVGSKWWLTTMSEQQSSCRANWLSFDILIVVHYFTCWSKLLTQILVQFDLYSLIFCQFFLHELWYCKSVEIERHKIWYPVQSSLFNCLNFTILSNRCTWAFFWKCVSGVFEWSRQGQSHLEQTNTGIWSNDHWLLCTVQEEGNPPLHHSLSVWL